jgi:hypothetical protein
MLELIQAQLPIEEAWNLLLNFHSKISPAPYWKLLAKLHVKEEQQSFLEWLENMLSEESPSQDVIAFWVGITLFEHEGKEIPTIYFTGSNTYSVSDIEWACDPVYLPQNRYVQPPLLLQIKEIVSLDKENYTFLDWILPLAYLSFTFNDLFCIKPKLLPVPNNQSIVHFIIGYDDGDFVVLK